MKVARWVRRGVEARPSGRALPTLRKDLPKAPQGFCKHRISYGIHKRAMALAQEKLAQLDGTGTGQQPAEHPKPEAPATPAMPLPEAPASANVYVTLAGRKVQVTLRDTDETRLLQRLDALLKRFPVAEEPGEPTEGWCRTHQVQMTQHHNAKGTWWSHKTAAGWCHGK